MSLSITTMIKPIAVLISDVHYSLATLELADLSFRGAIKKAAQLQVPLIDCGDLTNDKAIIRAEVANRLIETLDWAKGWQVDVTLLVGNHSLINEKGKEHALNFLAPYATIIDTPTDFAHYRFIPYQSSNEDFLKALERTTDRQIVIAHQGFKGAFMGDYIQDTSSVDPEKTKPLRIFSGHYHRHQTLDNITYVGNPYTLSYGEANDGEKGFLVLYSDGTVSREILNLRKHIVWNGHIDSLKDIAKPNPSDLLWLKVTGPSTELRNLSKNYIANNYIGHSNFRLDLIPVDIMKESSYDHRLSDADLMDQLIHNVSRSDDDKNSLKATWRRVYESP